MAIRLLVCAMAAALACGGCSVEVDDDEGTVHVTAPGVDVHVDEEEGVAVSAPGVDVEISPLWAVDDRDVRRKAQPGSSIRKPTYLST